MEENTEKLKVNSKEIEKPIRNEKGQLLPGVVLNPKGRPQGSLDFKTKFEIFLDKLAKQNNMSPQEIDEQLFAVAYKKAKEGDYQFWRDVHDRVYGKPLQKQQTDITSGGKPIIQIAPEILQKHEIDTSPEQNSQE